MHRVAQPTVAHERRRAARGWRRARAREYPPANTPTSDVFVITRSWVGDLRPLAAGEADREQSPVARQRAGGVLGERATDGVVEQVDAPAVGELAERGRERPVAVVDRRVGTELAAERGALVVAHDRDHAGAERAAELDRGDPAAAGGTEHGQPVALGELTPVDEADPPGEVRDPEPGRLGVGEAVGNGERAVGRRQALLGERAVARR